LSAQAKDKKETLADKVHKLSSELEALQDENSELRVTIDKMQMQVRTASKLEFNLGHEISQWKDQLIESEAEVCKLSSRVNELIDQMTALKANYEKERNSLASKIEILQL